MTLICFSGSGRLAGGFATELSVNSSCCPLHGQLMVPSETLVTRQPWRLQMSEKALNSPLAG